MSIKENEFIIQAKILKMVDDPAVSKMMRSEDEELPELYQTRNY